MVIKVSDRWRLVSDEHSWGVQRWRGQYRRRGGEVEERWDTCSWHSEVEEAIVSMVKRRIRLVEEDEVEKIGGEVERIRVEAQEAVELLVRLGVVGQAEVVQGLRKADVALSDTKPN